MNLSWPEHCPWCGHGYDPHIFVAQSYALFSLPGGQVARLPDVVTVQCPLPACDCETTWEKVPSPQRGEMNAVTGNGPVTSGVTDAAFELLTRRGVSIPEPAARFAVVQTDENRQAISVAGIFSSVREAEQFARAAGWGDYQVAPFTFADRRPKGPDRPL